MRLMAVTTSVNNGDESEDELDEISLSGLSETNDDDNTTETIPLNFRKMLVSELRKLAVDKGLAIASNKLKKAELIAMLETN